MTDFVSKWKNGLERTRKTTFGRISTFFGATQINSQAWEQLEALLIQADMGIEVTELILASLRKIVAERGFTRRDELQQSVHNELFNRLEPAPNFDLDAFHPTVILLVGVNGSGKTTTAAKLGKQFALQGKKVLLAAADTYRAAAVEQLQVWAERLDLPIITGQPDADPGAVAYDAVQAALARKMDVLLVDTAGRLHTRYNLMEELKKGPSCGGQSYAGCAARHLAGAGCHYGTECLAAGQGLQGSRPRERDQFWPSWILPPGEGWRLPFRANWACPFCTLAWEKSLKICRCSIAKPL